MPRKRTPRILAGYTHHNKVRLVHGGQDYFSQLVEMIDKAKSTIHLQTYIYDADETGRMVAEALIRAARRKVEVFILLDGYASQELPKHFIKEWKVAGIKFRWFWPLLKSRNFYLGRRLHHKVLVVDGAYGLAGGVNISNRYNDIDGKKAWLDRALYVEGQAALKLHIICRDMWEKAYWKKITGDKVPSTWLPGIVPAEECMVRVRRNDWVQGKNQISFSYLEMFRNAKSRITIMSSYFLPGPIFRKQMALAAKRGVSVKIIVAGVSDVRISRLAEQYMYRWLFRNHIEIYEYQDTILHGKMAAYDSSWMTVGSYNVNKISAYASVELNMDVRNPEFAAGVEQEMDAIIRDHCLQITQEAFLSHTSAWEKLLQMLAYETIRILFYLFTFYFKQQKE
jgi:cardiolipin synthase A/B